ncbi:hypothetical protein VTO73DRAFT_9047 [Trametes versicolor]
MTRNYLKRTTLLGIRLQSTLKDYLVEGRQQSVPRYSIPNDPIAIEHIQFVKLRSVYYVGPTHSVGQYQTLAVEGDSFSA